MRNRLLPLALLVACSLGIPAARAQTPNAHPHAPPGGAGMAHLTPPPDTRQPVDFPPMLRTHTLTNMRDHLQTLAEIQQLLGGGRLEAAGDLAEQRLGMSSLPLHGADQVAPYMPKGMQDAGTAMHRAASRFAIAARDASVSGDPKVAMAALAQVTATCVACHAAYRLE